MGSDELVLKSLGAVDNSGRITSMGEQMVKIPTDPRAARALLEGAPLFGALPVAEAVALLASSERIASADLQELLVSIRRASHSGHRAWKHEAAAHGTAGGGEGSRQARTTCASHCFVGRGIISHQRTGLPAMGCPQSWAR
ncbi:hypothetical protein AAHB37_14615 [Glutamicibacter halophytocola]|uniref:hypothetical protein n=1 Tax=Glutamicibacter halophytocola TaxID=1933880 RepID=UPI003219C9A7